MQNVASNKEDLCRRRILWIYFYPLRILFSSATPCTVLFLQILQKISGRSRSQVWFGLMTTEWLLVAVTQVGPSAYVTWAERTVSDREFHW